MMQVHEHFANAVGMNMFVFNYRGVGFSQGSLVEASDLVADGTACLEHLMQTGASPLHVLLFGHSIGGGVAARVRAEHSPAGPLVLDRTFSNLGSAASGIFSALLSQIANKEWNVPRFIVVGLLSSVFKGRLDTVEAWRSITGPRLVMYHLEDSIIKYEKASAHFELDEKGLIEAGEAIGLGAAGDGVNNQHNFTMDRFPEYLEILRKCRVMVGLNPDR